MAEQAAAKQASIYAHNLAALGLMKKAEDALNPASISGGGTVDPAKPPEGVSAAEEGVPNEPSDVNAQKSKMLSSNDAAINYTRRDAKADPKSDMADVIKEPAQTSSTDKVLDTAFDHTDEAGAKISSATRVAAARAILSKLAAEMNVKKKKAMGMAPSPSPSAGAGGSTAPVSADPVM